MYTHMCKALTACRNEPFGVFGSDDSESDGDSPDLPDADRAAPCPLPPPPPPPPTALPIGDVPDGMRSIR